MSVHVEVDPSALSLAAGKLRRSVADDSTALAAGAGGGLFRRTANTGEYPGLGVPMQLRPVRPCYAEGGP